MKLPEQVSENYSGIETVRNTIKMFAKKKVNLPPGRQKIVILDEVDRSVPSLFLCAVSLPLCRLSFSVPPLFLCAASLPRLSPQYDISGAAGAPAHDGALLDNYTLRVGLQHVRYAVLWNQSCWI